MHLTKLKLSGFKSFADVTSINITKSHTAIVGPNGCGKSNIIDAVRWVLGESSAKQLRGQAMADVIFNGTSERKPVGQASIELFFDNTSSALSNEYARYHEIAIRRQLNRDGTSLYYLNGTQCRRKDIVDIFLGTGLGPYSYAIVEQGMITQLIEAKPEELRTYLEEAAGISKYKERRRETENRMQHTRDNLARLQDIRQELENQLKHLKRQANIANRYQQLKQQQRLVKAQLHATNWQIVNTQALSLEHAINEQTLVLEAKRTEITKVDSTHEQSRLHLRELNDTYQTIQASYYQLGTDIARLEQQIEHGKERRDQLANDLAQIKEAYNSLQDQLQKDKTISAELTDELKTLTQQKTNILEQIKAANKKLHVAEEIVLTWQSKWDAFNKEVSANQQQFEVTNTRINYLKQNIVNINERLAKLLKEQEEVNDGVLSEEITQLTTQHEQLQLKKDKYAKMLLEKKQQINLANEQNGLFHKEINDIKHKLQQAQGRHSSLEALQQEALGKKDKNLSEWLQQQKWQAKSRLAEELQVEKGWEKAVEVVLEHYLEAICLEEEPKIALDNLPLGNITLIVKNNRKTTKSTTLASKIKSSYSVVDLLGHIYVAESYSDALTLKDSLSPGESVVTRDGTWLGNNWSRFCLNKDSKYGIIQREQELQNLTKEITIFQQLITQKDQEITENKQQIQELEKEYAKLQQEQQQLILQQSQVYGNLTANKTRLEHLKQRSVILAREISEQQQQLTSLSEELQQCTIIVNQTQQLKLEHDKKMPDLTASHAHDRQALERIQSEMAKLNKTSNDLEMNIKLNDNKLQYYRQDFMRVEKQLGELKERENKITQELIESESQQKFIEELNKALEEKIIFDKKLAQAKQQVEAAADHVQILEKTLTSLRKQEQELHGQLEQIRLEQKALQVRAQNYEEKVSETGFVLTHILDEMPKEMDLELENKFNSLAKRIEQLGPINLAAIEECQQKQQRKDYLDAQNNDLTEALKALDDAIHKIDQETKERFKNAFNRVNEELQRLFPIIFGGGKASLEMTENDLLNTGVIILAQPPGKRNVTIHLLSGGEKTLTAVALIFAIFQLNPAPFCMLDEVDAPLDDNNTLKLGKMIKEMSAKTQFITVSHNKITMEMAEELIGVTMQEPGISRIVSVNIDQAIKWANEDKK